MRYFKNALALLAMPALAAQVTFTEHVAPIIYNRCTGCHRPGEAAPFSLETYNDVAKRGKTIAAVTSSRFMPPWKAEPASYGYRDSRRMTDAEIDTIQTWVKQGMVQGNSSKLPAVPKFPDGWQLGTPDIVVKAPVSFRVPADGADIYRYIRIPLNLPDDRWVQAIDLRPTARKQVHHVLFFADSAANAAKVEADQEASGNSAGMRLTPGLVPLGGIAVGAQPHLLPAGLAFKLPKGADLLFQYHFHPTGKEEAEQSIVGIYFAKNPPEHTLTAIQLPVAYGLFSGLHIKPGEKSFAAQDSFVLPVDVEAVSVGAHAHYIGKTMKMTATFPDGTVKTLLDIKDWDFAWQDRYFFEAPLLLPKGTKLEGFVTWDNSAENAKNPTQPPGPVEWGEQSKDEMGAVSLQVYPVAESDLATLRGGYRQHVSMRARERIMIEPGVMTKVLQFVGTGGF